MTPKAKSHDNEPGTAAYCPRCGVRHENETMQDEWTLCARCRILDALLVERFMPRRRK